jgi:hypothetical protein
MSPARERLVPPTRSCTAINKLNGNNLLKANSDSPTFTGTVQGITAAMVGLGNVTIPAMRINQFPRHSLTALNTKADAHGIGVKSRCDCPGREGTARQSQPSPAQCKASPLRMVGLGNVTNTSDADKPVSTAQLAALNAKADLTALALKADVTALGREGTACQSDLHRHSARHHRCDGWPRQRHQYQRCG